MEIYSTVPIDCFLVYYLIRVVPHSYLINETTMKSGIKLGGFGFVDECFRGDVKIPFL